MTYEEIGKVFVKLRQKISSEMLLALQESAKLHGVSIDVEVASRIWLTFAEPEALGLDSTSIRVLKQGFSYPQAVLECKRKREAWAYLCPFFGIGITPSSLDEYFSTLRQ